MNPILLKTLISLAASNKKPAPDGSVGSDAQLKNRIVLFADETVDLPDWGISGLPAMILGAAPQTCLFVSDLNVDGAPETDGTTKTEDADKDTTSDAGSSDAGSSGTVSFSLTIKSPPAPESTLQARTIVWKLSLPIAGYRDVQTGASSAAVHAPVIKSRLSLGGVARDVEIGLLEMGGLEQPLLIGKDTLADKFLIRPDRPEDQKAPASPSVDLTPKPAKPAETKPASETSDTSATKPDAAPTTDSKPETPAPAKTGNEDTPADSTSPSAPQADTPDTPATDQAQDSQTPDTKQDDPAQQPAAPSTADTNTDTTSAPNTADTPDKAASPDSPSKPAEDSNTPASPTPSQTESDTANPPERETQPA